MDDGFTLLINDNKRLLSSDRLSRLKDIIDACEKYDFWTPQYGININIYPIV